MARKIPLTRPELKRQRDMLARFERYLPMLKLKQQQLQLAIGQALERRDKALADLQQARAAFDRYKAVLNDLAGVNVRQLARCTAVRTSQRNIAGVNVPVFEGAEFPPARYSLFGTPPWVDAALADLRRISRCQAQADVIAEEYALLRHELIKVVQRVNLFEKVKIPQSREAIRVIRIRLGDEQTAAVGRAKIAKTKIVESESEIYGPEGTDSTAEVFSA
jgi:V/A-type H+-transporting ATPase subunit D